MSLLELPIRSFAAVTTETSVCVALSITSIIGNRLVCRYQHTETQNCNQLPTSMSLL